MTAVKRANDNQVPDYIPTELELARAGVTRAAFDAAMNFKDLFFVLDAARRPVAATQAEWEGMALEARCVAESQLSDEVSIRTSFDGSVWSPLDDPELVFETTVTINDEPTAMGRWRSWEEAAAGHEQHVRIVRGKLSRKAPPKLTVVF